MNKKRSFSVLIFLCALVFAGFYLKAEIQKHAQTPTWRGITPGVSTQNEVLDVLGQPAEQTSEPSMFAYWEEDFRHEVYFRGDTVWLIRAVTGPDQKGNWPQADDFVELYGPPQAIFWSTWSSSGRIVPFCENGIFIEGNHSGIIASYYFEPMSLSKCVREFSDFIAAENPFPNSDMKMVRDPWGYTEER